MAVTAATKTSDFSGFIPVEIAEPIFERAARVSVVQQLSQRIQLGYQGKSVPYVTGRPVAGWVSEGAQKPATKGTMSLATMTPKKLAAIAVVSAEVVRANPGGYVDTIQPQLAEAFGKAFDWATLHNLGGDGTGSGPFSTYLDQATATSEIGTNAASAGGVYKDFVDALAKIVSTLDATGRRHQLTGWAVDNVLEPIMLGAVDTTGQPTWKEIVSDDSAPGLARQGRILNRPSFMGEGVATPNLDNVVGYGGDWTQTAWGVVSGISYDISTQATVTINGSLVSLWENNLVAIRAEAEYGWLVNDVSAFVKLTNTNNSPITSS